MEREIVCIQTYVHTNMLTHTQLPPKITLTLTPTYTLKKCRYYSVCERVRDRKGGKVHNLESIQVHTHTPHTNLYRGEREYKREEVNTYIQACNTHIHDKHPV